MPSPSSSASRTGTPCAAVAARAGASETQCSGFAAEQVALDYLLSRGLRLVMRNFRVRIGEIDLVMADADQIVFVEVRKRASDRFGGAAASVTPQKQRRVRRAAQAFLLASFGAGRWPAMRFDVVAIEGATVRWIPAAF